MVSKKILGIERATWAFVIIMVGILANFVALLPVSVHRFLTHPAVYGWAQAVLTALAVAVAVWAATHPLRVRQERERQDGASAAAGTRGRVEAIIEDIVAVCVKAAECARKINQSAADLEHVQEEAGNSQEGIAPYDKALKKAESALNDCNTAFAALHENIEAIDLRLRAIPVDVIRRYDGLLADQIVLARDQLHHAERLVQNVPHIRYVLEPLNSAESLLKDYLCRLSQPESTIQQRMAGARSCGEMSKGSE